MNPHRSDLENAHARIADLEAKLRELESKSQPRVAPVRKSKNEWMNEHIWYKFHRGFFFLFTSFAFFVILFASALVAVMQIQK